MPGSPQPSSADEPALPRPGPSRQEGSAVPCAALLAFDTSTELMSIAAAGPDGVAVRDLPGGAAASAQLLPQVQAVLAEAGLTYADLAAIAFGRGPGAFTGLRTSCAVAQGLGLGLARPLLPLDSLLIVAEGSIDAAPAGALVPSAWVAVAMDARMEEIYGALYERKGSGWGTVLAPALYALAAWNAVLEENEARVQCLAGSALNVFGARLHRPPAARQVPIEMHRAAALLRLAQQAHATGAAVDAAAALPLYLRDKVALTTAERSRVKASASAGASAAASAAPQAETPSAAGAGAAR